MNKIILRLYCSILLLEKVINKENEEASLLNITLYHVSGVFLGKAGWDTKTEELPPDRSACSPLKPICLDILQNQKRFHGERA